MSAGRALFFAAAAALAGCSLVAPYPTEPREAKDTDVDPRPRVAICYDGLASKMAEVQRAAQAECPAKTVATLHDTDYQMEFCPLLLPARATFVCQSKP
jgi:hypothetical protein